MKVNLGCGLDIRPEYVNVDRVPGAGVDLVADINERLPFDDSEVDEIVAHDVIEHLRNGLVPFMDEAWRILKPDGILNLRTGTPDHPQIWADPEHVRPYTLETFDYFDPSTHWWKKYGSLYTKNYWSVVKRHENAGMISVIMRKLA